MEGISVITHTHENKNWDIILFLCHDSHVHCVAFRGRVLRPRRILRLTLPTSELENLEKRYDKAVYDKDNYKTEKCETLYTRSFFLCTNYLIDIPDNYCK